MLMFFRPGNTPKNCINFYLHTHAFCTKFTKVFAPCKKISTYIEFVSSKISQRQVSFLPKSCMNC